MVAVEGQRDSAPHATWPLSRPQSPPGTHAIDELAPLFLGPLPGFKVGLGSVHAFVLLVHSLIGTSRWKGEGSGRSGEIRTHDPQHPMLMRYQAALRSDRGGSADAIDHNDTPRAVQLATYHDVSLRLITARGACRAKLGFPEARAAPPPKPLAGLAERGREHPQRWADRLSDRAETASPGRLSRPAAPEPPCPAAHPRGATSGPRGSCILPDKGTVGSAAAGQRPPADSNGGHPLV